MNTNSFINLTNKLNANLLTLDTFLLFLDEYEISFHEYPLSIDELVLVLETSPNKCAAVFKSYESPSEHSNDLFIPKFIYILDEQFKFDLAKRYHQIKESNDLIINFLNSQNLLNTEKWLSNWPEEFLKKLSPSNEELLTLESFEKLSFQYAADYQFFEDLNYLFIKINNKLYYTNPLILNNPFSDDELVYVELNQFHLVDNDHKHDILSKIAEQDLISQHFYSNYKTFIA